MIIVWFLIFSLLPEVENYPVWLPPRPARGTWGPQGPHEGPKDLKEVTVIQVARGSPRSLAQLCTFHVSTLKGNRARALHLGFLFCKMG